MPLPEDYLNYPARKYGMDQLRYAWRPAIEREPVRLADGVKVAASIVVPIEFFPLDPPAKPFKHPGAMVTPYPDLRHFTTRDYGNRVGVYRLLRVLSEFGVSATFAVNAEIVRRYPALIDAIRSGGHEIAAHGLSTAHIHHAGLAEAEESEMIGQVRASLPEATSWLSPARNQSFNTLDLIVKAGFSTCLDWEIDQVPVAFETAAGKIACVPNHVELSDWTLLVERSQTEDQWRRQIADAADLLLGEYDDRGSQSFGFAVTPYVTGQPFRIAAFRQLLAELSERDGVRLMTAGAVAGQFGLT